MKEDPWALVACWPLVCKSLEHCVSLTCELWKVCHMTSETFCVMCHKLVHKESEHTLNTLR